METKERLCTQLMKLPIVLGVTNGQFVARVNNPSDAQLIASAPELLEAAMFTLQSLDNPGNLPHARKLLVDAINKATIPLGGVGYADRSQLS